MFENYTSREFDITKDETVPEKFPKRAAHQMMDHSGSRPTQMEISWRGLNYKVRPGWLSRQFRYEGVPQDGEVHILKNITGSIRARELTALMGPSGSGKSTLMNCLMGLNNGRGQDGRFLVRGFHWRQNAGIQISAVPQKDEFHARFTVAETLRYASRLKNPKFSHAQHGIIVANVVNQLELQGCANNRVANCSGGQVKRLAIGCELVSLPDILLLDEPTSGLDVATCNKTVSLLARIAHTNPRPMAILVSIHQPSADILMTFDHLYVLSRDGRCAYDGPPRKVPSVCELVMNKPFGKYINPADTIIELASGGHGLDLLEKLVDFQRKIHDEQLDRVDVRLIPKLMAQASFDSIGSCATLQKRMSYAEEDLQDQVGVDMEMLMRKPDFPFWNHVGILVRRNWSATLKDPMMMTLRLSAHFMIPLFTSILFGHKMGSANGCPLPHVLNMQLSDLMSLTTDTHGIQRNLYELFQNFAWVYVMLFQLCLVTVAIFSLSFPLEAKILKKEYRNGWYSTGSYFTALSLAELPFQIVLTTIFVSLQFWLTGQDISSTARLSGVTVICILMASIAQSQGLLSGAVFMDNPVSAVFIGAAYCVPMAHFSNYFVRLKAMNAFGSGVTLSSYFYYGINGIIAILYGLGRCTCRNVDLNFDEEDTTGEASPFWGRHINKILGTYISYSSQGGASPWAQTVSNETQKFFNFPLESVLETVSKRGLWAQNCTAYAPLPYTEFNIDESFFQFAVYSLIAYAVLARLLTYWVVRLKVR